MNIAVCCPSYKRPKVETLDYLPFCRVYVDGKEYDDYVKANPKGDIVKCPDGIQGNLCRVRNYIIDNELNKNNCDAVLIIDDDLKGIFYYEKKERIKVEKEDFLNFLQKYTLLAKELGAKFWGVNVNADKQCYREYSPFSTVSYIGGPFQCFLKGNNCYYDENLPLKEDYDMTLQQLNKNRVVLRVNKYFYDCKQSKQAGGCATYRNSQKEMQQLLALQKKWGKDIVRFDNNDRSHSGNNKKRKVFDYNPVINVPIKGI